MRYSIRPGVTRVEICGTYLLIPDRKTSVYCAEIIPLNVLGAALWGLLGEGKTIEELCAFYRIVSRKSEGEAVEEVNSFLTDLCEKGYLIPVEDET